jgi:Flp pilus assembly pilin Flp
MFTGSLKRFISDESGQGITEYGAILAFVAVLVALVFTMTSGGLRAAISNAFSTVVNQLNNLAANAS